MSGEAEARPIPVKNILSAARMSVRKGMENKGWAFSRPERLKRPNENKPLREGRDGTETHPGIGSENRINMLKSSCLINKKRQNKRDRGRAPFSFVTRT